MADLQKSLKDAAYIGIGFGVIGFQKAQVLRHDLTKQVKQRLETTEIDLRVEGLGDLGERIQPMLERIEDLAEELAPQAREMVDQATGMAVQAGQHLSERVKAFS